MTQQVRDTSRVPIPWRWIVGGGILAILWLSGIWVWIGGAGYNNPLFGWLILLWPLLIIGALRFIRPTRWMISLAVVYTVGLYILINSSGEQLPSALTMLLVFIWFPLIIGAAMGLNQVREHYPDNFRAIEDSWRTTSSFVRESVWTRWIAGLLALMLVVGMTYVGEWWYGLVFLLGGIILFFVVSWGIALIWIPPLGREVRRDEIFYYERPYWPAWFDFYWARFSPVVWGERDDDEVAHGGLMGISRVLWSLMTINFWVFIILLLPWIVITIVLFILGWVILGLLCFIYWRVHLYENRHIDWEGRVTITRGRIGLLGPYCEVETAVGRELNAAHFNIHSNGLGKYCDYDPKALRLGSTADDPIGITKWMLWAGRVNGVEVMGPLFKFNLDRLNAYLDAKKNDPRAVRPTPVFLDEYLARRRRVA